MNDPIAPDRIGRFSRGELEAMRGKRGRKPAEYFELFPDLKREPAPRAETRAGESAPAAAAAASACAEPRLAYEADPLVARLALASPDVRQLIGNLLDLLGVPHGGVAAVDHPPSALPLPDSSAVGDAVVSTPASDAVVVEPPVAPEPVYREPVYADPEADAAQVAEDEALGLAG